MFIFLFYARVLSMSTQFFSEIFNELDTPSNYDNIILNHQISKEERIRKINLELNSLKDDMSIIRRKNDQITNETNNYIHQRELNNDTLINLSTEKLTLAKKMLSDDNEMESLELKTYPINLEKLEDKLVISNQPTVDEFYLEIMKGFNVKINEEEVIVTNLEKNDIYTYKLNECNKDSIWTNL
ncbi:hypothetical protein SLOPH_1689 [Spraguea lophii 42_110]|uniref:Kinetochore protein Spc24 n=1 Tax=Spraguea lophii (strain 42_110) TaxID=1358809 RepID=S7W9J2_SPRLO|nr:hypothetical protein SLOPH_1689 [Spraguea lophii 42_110]